MQFRLEVNAPPAEFTGVNEDVTLAYNDCTGVQITKHPNQIYDLVHRITWVHEGRAYEATIRRARQHGHVGPG